MSQKDFRWLVGSIILSIILWGILRNWAFGCIIVSAIMIHEYGHYYWMSKEGIRNKTMLAIPLMGALAVSREFWSSRGAEMRIALAGPAFGIFSVMLFYALWILTGSDIFGAAIILACYINLFNLLLPVPLLDGGRVIKSFLFTLNEQLGIRFYYFGFGILVYLTLIVRLFPLFFGFFIGWMLWQDYKQLNYLEVLKLKPLSSKEALNGGLIYFGIISIYILVLQYMIVLQYMSSFPDITLETLS